MGLHKVKALTFDTGGTVLDWHSGFSTAMADVGAKYGIKRDWGKLANETVSYTHLTLPTKRIV